MPKCLACHAALVEPFLDLGRMALANKFLSAAELTQPEPTYPLRVGFCRACRHVQLLEAVPPAAMFTDYLYVSSASDTLRRHLSALSDTIAARQRLGARDLVVDIGCNDGTLLQGFQRHGVRTLGVDPAVNLAALTAAAGLDRHIGFFNSRTADEILRRWGPAAVITATNTFPHIPELWDFLAGIRTVLAPTGVFVIEVHYLLDLLEQKAFDTIYHEHVSYWALQPMLALFERHGLQVVHVERLPIHHGQLRVWIQPAGAGQVQSSVAELLAVETACGLGELATFQAFAAEILQIKAELRRVLTDLKAAGQRVVGYGAPAKGNTLLSILDIGPDLLPYIADRSPLKQGRYTPGMHIPIVPPEQLLADQPDYVLVLAWNFVDEIVTQQAEYRRRGGQFIVPVPAVRVVG